MSDPEIDRWQRDWQSGSLPVADLPRMAQRERRWLLAWIASDWLAGAALIAFAAWLWIDDGSTVMRFAAAAIVVLVVAALGFTVVNWRGSFAAEQTSTADYLTLAEHRSRARLRYVSFAWWVLAADLAVIAIAMALEYRDSGAGRLPAMAGYALAATAVAAAILWWWGRRERRRGERLAAMRAALADEAGAP